MRLTGLRPRSRPRVSTDPDGLGITEDTANLDTLEATDLDTLEGLVTTLEITDIEALDNTDLDILDAMEQDTLDKLDTALETADLDTLDNTDLYALDRMGHY